MKQVVSFRLEAHILDQLDTFAECKGLSGGRTGALEYLLRAFFEERRLLLFADSQTAYNDGSDPNQPVLITGNWSMP